ncbi:hypothetical protein [Schaalia meyeri]|uniref:hypothetical protein n=1 Tax=Schaalia meyeri TaxID=52773 RepID=UPI0012FEB29B|nr:hypothetical protein [Schaalia meyeri]
MAVVRSGEGIPDLAMANPIDAMSIATNVEANTPRSALSVFVGIVSRVPTGAD